MTEQKCCVRGCNSYLTANISTGVSWYSLPQFDRTTREKWLKFILGEEESEVIQADLILDHDEEKTTNWKVCSLHFESQPLESGAIPTIRISREKKRRRPHPIDEEPPTKAQRAETSLDSNVMQPSQYYDDNEILSDLKKVVQELRKARKEKEQKGQEDSDQEYIPVNVLNSNNPTMVGLSTNTNTEHITIENIEKENNELKGALSAQREECKTVKEELSSYREKVSILLLNKKSEVAQIRKALSLQNENVSVLVLKLQEEKKSKLAEQQKLKSQISTLKRQIKELKEDDGASKRTLRYEKDMHQATKAELAAEKEKTQKLQADLDATKFRHNTLKEDPKLFQYYTGFTVEAFATFYQFLGGAECEKSLVYKQDTRVTHVCKHPEHHDLICATRLKRGPTRMLSIVDELLLVLCKLRLGLGVVDLAARFKTSASQVSHICSAWRPVMKTRLQEAGIWHEGKESKYQSTPDYLKPLYQKIKLLIEGIKRDDENLIQLQQKRRNKEKSDESNPVTMVSQADLEL